MALSHRRGRRTAGAATALALGASLVTASAAAPAAADPVPAEPGELRIHDVQGTTRTSPHAGRAVADLPGIVTAVNPYGSARGFWFQDPEGDDDPRTSEGLFVFTGSSTPDVEAGDEVLVSGTVAEYSPGAGLQTITQLGDASWTVLGGGRDLPEAVGLAPGTVPEAYAPEGGDIGDLPLEPDTYALDFWAAGEHMRVRIEDARVVGPTDPYAALWVTTEPGHNPTPRGGTAYGSYADPNSGRLKIESLLPRDQAPFPQADVGDELAGVTEGPLYYGRYGGYVVKATTMGEHVDNGLPRGTAAEPRDGELSVATYNVENLSAASDQAAFDRLAEGIADGLGAPDIVALEEIQDDNGPTDDGTVTAGRTLDRLAEAVAAAGGPDYEWRQIDPENNADGGQPGGNIRNAFLFDPESVSFVDRPGGDATTPVEVVEGDGGRAALSVSPGRIEPGDDAWLDSRKPLAGEFEFEGRTVVVVTNHFTSKGGDQPLHGLAQPPERASEVQRNAQAGLVRAFADEVLDADPAANVVVAGDLNDFSFSRTLEVLTGDGGLYNPMLDLPEGERYNYLFDGNSQALDHMLVAPRLSGRTGYEIVRINAEFHDRASDHDPQILRFRPLSGSRGTDAREEAHYGRPGRR
ncbi:endonuclease/exonuclease/phosphatase family protein [Nocardiopsis sediminis]|uniref:Endonuclease/exonuclease/phosphatase family protein n=1 Tax=Nocardiopsis sediminis TaxID=1778267 RepID=A0ABV8FJI3_9ACTN